MSFHCIFELTNMINQRETYSVCVREGESVQRCLDDVCRKSLEYKMDTNREMKTCVCAFVSVRNLTRKFFLVFAPKWAYTTMGRGKKPKFISNKIDKKLLWFLLLELSKLDDGFEMTFLLSNHVLKIWKFGGNKLYVAREIKLVACHLKILHVQQRCQPCEQVGRIWGIKVFAG